MSDTTNDAFIAESREIADRINAITGGRPVVAVYLAIAAILGNIEMRVAAPRRRDLLEIISAAMDEFIANNSGAPPKADQSSDHVPQATSISCGACDFCPAVHVNMLDADGEVFATASVPAATGEAFIAQFRAAMSELTKRHSAPVRRQ